MLETPELSVCSPVSASCSPLVTTVSSPSLSAACVLTAVLGESLMERTEEVSSTDPTSSRKYCPFKIVGILFYSEMWTRVCCLKHKPVFEEARIKGLDLQSSNTFFLKSNSDVFFPFFTLL